MTIVQMTQKLKMLRGNTSTNHYSNRDVSINMLWSGASCKIHINYELEPFNIQVVSYTNTGDIRLEDKLAGA